VGVSIVAAVARNGVIGAGGALPWHLPDELRLFKETTMGHVLVMGRRTYESVGRPLPGRTTVVVTRSPDWSPDADEVLVVHGIDEALGRARAIDDEVFVVGGGELYEAALPHADRLLLTFVDQDPEGDTTFPDVDWDAWTEIDREPGDGWLRVTYERSRR